MLRRIEPSVIICYSTPFTEMQGNIVHVDYELSSWKHDEDDAGNLDHGPPEGPHWDYNDGMNGHFRIFPDGSASPKSFEGDMIYA